MAAAKIGRRNALRTVVQTPKAFLILLSVYAAVLMALLSKLPLWLDEIVDLKGIRDYDFARLIAWVPANAGGVPLGYITRFATVHVLGYSTFSGRLPSAVFSLVACGGVFVLARRLQLRFPLLPVVIFSIAPLQLRYALESRPYSLALALSIWATVAFLDLVERVTFWRAVLYGLLVLLGLYTQPYTLFVPLAHLAWLCCAGSDPAGNHAGRWHLVAVSGVAVALACLGFLPWYLWTTRVWNQSVAAQHLRYAIGPRAALVISKELVGAGYFGTALILVAAWLGLQEMGAKHRLPQDRARLLWVLYAVVPVLLALLADAIFGYFLAIRQMIFILTPLSLLAALGMQRLSELRGRAAVAAGCALILTFATADVRFFLRPREDWGAAASILEGLERQGSCVVFAPPGYEGFYEFFVPGLSLATCSADFARSRAVAVATSPYGPQQESQLLRKLAETGFRKTREFNSQGPRISLYER